MLVSTSSPPTAGLITATWRLHTMAATVLQCNAGNKLQQLTSFPSPSLIFYSPTLSAPITALIKSTASPALHFAQMVTTLVFFKPGNLYSTSRAKPCLGLGEQKRIGCIWIPPAKKDMQTWNDETLQLPQTLRLRAWLNTVLFGSLRCLMYQILMLYVTTKCVLVNVTLGGARDWLLKVTELQTKWAARRRWRHVRERRGWVDNRADLETFGEDKKLFATAENRTEVSRLSIPWPSRRAYWAVPVSCQN
jgi:hypothetical protein